MTTRETPAFRQDAVIFAQPAWQLGESWQLAADALAKRDSTEPTARAIRQCAEQLQGLAQLANAQAIERAVNAKNREGG